MHAAASFRFFGYFTILPSSFLKITSCQGVSVKSEDSRRIYNFQEMVRAFRDWAGSRLSPAADEPTVVMGLRRRIQWANPWLRAQIWNPVRSPGSEAQCAAHREAQSGRTTGGKPKSPAARDTWHLLVRPSSNWSKLSSRGPIWVIHGSFPMDLDILSSMEGLD